jgi:hypothetical protein
MLRKNTDNTPITLTSSRSDVWENENGDQETGEDTSHLGKWGKTS